jgi:uncharacterized membrane protein (DUF441 family)
MNEQDSGNAVATVAQSLVGIVLVTLGIVVALDPRLLNLHLVEGDFVSGYIVTAIVFAAVTSSVALGGLFVMNVQNKFVLLAGLVFVACSTGFLVYEVLISEMIACNCLNGLRVRRSLEGGYLLSMFGAVLMIFATLHAYRNRRGIQKNRGFQASSMGLLAVVLLMVFMQGGGEPEQENVTYRGEETRAREVDYGDSKSTGLDSKVFRRLLKSDVKSENGAWSSLSTVIGAKPHTLLLVFRPIDCGMCFGNVPAVVDSMRGILGNDAQARAIAFDTNWKELNRSELPWREAASLSILRIRDGAQLENTLVLVLLSASGDVEHSYKMGASSARTGADLRSMTEAMKEERRNRE